MYLININTLELEEFIEGQIPPYAILSHRWGAEELNFREVLKKRVDQNKRGYRKLTEACRIAANYNVIHLWIDTCCIDKRSSAELSEAINSMFSWYEKAEVCLAYLEDVESGPTTEQTFRNSVWFTRAWTLQELLAPAHVDFYTGSWDYITSKEAHAHVITAVTGIPQEALTKTTQLSSFNIACRMSWASDRKATRTEDIAYSLMGIFNINMPLLYGEGTKAFLRLQEEIIRDATELSFLLWDFGSAAYRLLARSPSDFRDDARRSHFYHPLEFTQLNFTKRGLEIETTLYRWDFNMYGMTIASDGLKTIILLLGKHYIPNMFYRIGIRTIITSSMTSWSRKKEVTLLSMVQEAITRDPSLALELDLNVENGFRVRTDEQLPLQFHNSVRTKWDVLRIPTRGRGYYNRGGLICKFSDPKSLGLAIMEYNNNGFPSFCIELFFTFDSIPCVLVTRSGVMRSWTFFEPLLEWEPATPSSSYIESGLPYLKETSEQTHEGKLWRYWGTKYDRNYYRIPENFTHPDPPLWVSFVRPQSGENESWFWCIHVSRVDLSPF